MPRRPLILGFLIWLAATLALRVAGQRIVPTTGPAIVATFALSFVAVSWLARRLCRQWNVPVAEWPAAAIALATPTLLLDPFSSAFFSALFPNIRADAAGAFGGWMLCCVAGAVCGACVGRPARRPNG
jgi:Family of unknown function (DUF5367)